MPSHPEAVRTHLETHSLSTPIGDLSVLWSCPLPLALPPATVLKHSPALWLRVCTVGSYAIPFVELSTPIGVATCHRSEACACAVVPRLYRGLYAISFVGIYAVVCTRLHCGLVCSIICVHARCLPSHPEAVRTHPETHSLSTPFGGLSVLWSCPPLLALPPSTVLKHAPVL